MGDWFMNGKFTEVDKGIIRNNEKTLEEISSRYSTYSKQGSKKKESTSAEDIIKSKKKQNKK